MVAHTASWQSRAHFFSAASQLMWRALVDQPNITVVAMGDKGHTNVTHSDLHWWTRVSDRHTVTNNQPGDGSAGASLDSDCIERSATELAAIIPNPFFVRFAQLWATICAFPSHSWD
jgi:hypothetical protein